MTFDKQKEDDMRIHEIIISTGNVNRSYAVRDIIFVAEKFETDLFDENIDPNESLQDIILMLKRNAFS